MMTNEKKLNRDLIIGWLIIVMVLFVTYLIEVVKGERTIAYVIVFMIATGLPPLFCALVYRKNPLNPRLRYWIVAGYFIMYLFVMVTGSTTLVFTYMLPLLSLLVLYHQPNLILVTGVITLIINIAFIVIRIGGGEITVSNSKEIEIQIAIFVLCYAGSYVGARLYDEIYHKNVAYVKELDEKSKQIQRMTLQTIETIAHTIDAKDAYTKGHSRRVSEYSAKIAEELDMTEEEIMNIRYIALLHDIGKIGVPDSVLNKPGRLTDMEFELMKKHTTIGGDILKDIGMLPDLDVGAKFHHEHYDGSGYPNGLKGEEIPLIARIICLADAYDAMTTDRIYRKRLSDEEVFEQLKRGRGKQFDPKITDVFIQILKTSPEGISTEREEVQQTLGDASSRLLQRIMDDQNKQFHSGNLLDELTGVYTRTAGEQKVEAAMETSKGCLVLVDIDSMRRINSEYGFRYGDQCLRTIADMLREVSMEIIVMRFGGDEFLCYLPNVTQVSMIEELIQDFMKEIHHTKVNGDLKEEFSVSAGVTIHEGKCVELHQLLMEADKALYHVKQEGGKGVYFYRQVAERNDDVTKINWNSVFEAIRSHGESGQLEEGYRELVRIYDKINSVEKTNSKNSKLVMFTAKSLDENNMSIEEREKVMHMIEYAISQTLQTDSTCSKYSSIQRIVMINGEQEEKVRELTESVLVNFYRMYDKKDIELYYDIAGVDTELSGKLLEE